MLSSAVMNQVERLNVPVGRQRYLAPCVQQYMYLPGVQQQPGYYTLVISPPWGRRQQRELKNWRVPLVLRSSTSWANRGAPLCIGRVEIPLLGVITAARSRLGRALLGATRTENPWRGWLDGGRREFSEP